MATTVTTTNTGKALAASQLAGTSSTPLRFIGCGTGTHTAAATDVDLTTPSGSRLGTNNPTIITTNVTNDTVSVIQSFTTGVGGVVLKEAGLFNAATSGIMAVSATFDAITLAEGEEVNFTFKTIVA